MKKLWNTIVEWATFPVTLFIVWVWIVMDDMQKRKYRKVLRKKEKS